MSLDEYIARKYLLQEVIDRLVEFKEYEEELKKLNKRFTPIKRK